VFEFFFLLNIVSVGLLDGMEAFLEYVLSMQPGPTLLSEGLRELYNICYMLTVRSLFTAVLHFHYVVPVFPSSPMMIGGW
jgi:hypothetical protein